jgi:hypothetical protein
VGVRELVALAVSATGLVLIVGGDPARARPLLEQSLPLFRQAGDRLDVAMVLGALGHLSASQGECAAATQLLKDSRALLREVGGQFTRNERLRQLMVTSEVPNFLGQVRLKQETRRAPPTISRHWARWPIAYALRDEPAEPRTARSPLWALVSSLGHRICGR